MFMMGGWRLGPGFWAWLGREGFGMWGNGLWGWQRITHSDGSRCSTEGGTSSSYHVRCLCPMAVLPREVLL